MFTDSNGTKDWYLKMSSCKCYHLTMLKMFGGSLMFGAIGNYSMKWWNSTVLFEDFHIYEANVAPHILTQHVACPSSTGGIADYIRNWMWMDGPHTVELHKFDEIWRKFPAC